MAENTVARQTLLRERLAKNLKIFRGRLGISQEALGERAGVHRTHIGQIEAGLKSITLDTLVQLADALAVDEIELLAIQDETPTPIKKGRRKKAEAPPSN
jgi:transcriptional regulator with XRE-family HTH domain